MRFLHEMLDGYGLRNLHKNKSIESQFKNENSITSIDNLDNFYSIPKIPNIQFDEEEKKSDYSIGKFRFESEVSNNVSNKYSSGMYYINDRLTSENTNCIIVHGWRMSDLKPIVQMFNENFIKENYNFFYYTLPYHFEREPKESMFNGELMVGANVDRTLLSVKQAVSDIRALIYWLKRYKKGKVVLIGVSLGGLVSNLVSVVESNFDALISLIYANSLAYSVWHTSPGKYIKQDYLEHNFSYDELRECWKIIDPSNFKPQIPKERILLMSGIYDRYVHIEDTSTLWEAWDRPRRLLYSCGHSGLVVKRRKIYKEVISFIKEL